MITVVSSALGVPARERNLERQVGRIRKHASLGGVVEPSRWVHAERLEHAPSDSHPTIWLLDEDVIDKGRVAIWLAADEAEQAGDIIGRAFFVERNERANARPTTDLIELRYHR